MNPFNLPEKILLGSATAATQIEGGDLNNSWYRWYVKGHIKNGSSSFRGADHWNRVEEDIALLVSMNQQIYRMGLEWSRIEPEDGVFDYDAIAHYRNELEMVKANGITPLLTLHHFSDPLWFFGKGGFENPESVEIFERYVSTVAEKLGDLTGEYVTFNEPNVYVTNGYIFGSWPPGKKKLRQGIKTYQNMIACHIAAYRAIHRIRSAMGFEGETRVGVAHHLRVFTSYSGSAADALAAQLMEYLFQGLIVRAMTDGLLLPPLGFGRPYGKGRFSDYLGVNYYTRSAVHFKGFREDTMPDTPRNDLNWEIYSQGLYQLCRHFYRKYKLPIWITENGTCDREDTIRPRYIYDHLKAVAELVHEGIPIDRYYHWSLLDNFEWLDGEAAPFGLVAVNFETQERQIRRSGQFYGEICKYKAVTEEMIRDYLNG